MYLAWNMFDVNEFFLLRFYQEFKASKEQNLEFFYRHYEPPVTEEHYTCVGLALELLCRVQELENKFPGLASYLYLASCEEVSLLPMLLWYNFLYSLLMNCTVTQLTKIM